MFNPYQNQGNMFNAPQTPGFGAASPQATQPQQSGLPSMFQPMPFGGQMPFMQPNFPSMYQFGRPDMSQFQNPMQPPMQPPKKQQNTQPYNPISAYGLGGQGRNPMGAFQMPSMGQTSVFGSYNPRMDPNSSFNNPNTGGDTGGTTDLSYDLPYNPGGPNDPYSGYYYESG